MANVDRHIHIHRLTELVYDRFGSYKTGSGKTIPVTRFRRQPRRADNETKKKNQYALRAAAGYASFAHTQAVYINQARQNDATAYSIALLDYLGAPRVLEIDVDGWTGEVGQTIRVKARDNVGVAGVLVVVRDPAGNILELGEAFQSQADSTWWNYTTRARVHMTPLPSVEAIARDLPGNRDSFIIS